MLPLRCPPSLLLLPLFAGCPTGTPSEDPTPDPPEERCEGSLAEGAVRVIATGLTGGTEGVAFSPDGRLFVSAGDAVREVQPDGQHAWFADVPSTVGLAVWGDELLVASSDDGLGSGGVYAVELASGAVRLLAAGIPSANFVAVTPWDTLLVSTPSGDEEIVEVSAAGDVSLWSAGVTSPNGMGFAEDGATLYAVTTFANPAPLWAVPVSEGVAGTPDTVTSWGPGTAPDGLAMGASDSVYVAQNLAGRIDRIRPDGTVEEVAEGVAFAASAAFGIGEGWDPCAVYVTSLATDELYVVGVGEPGGWLGQ